MLRREAKVDTDESIMRMVIVLLSLIDIFLAGLVSPFLFPQSIQEYKISLPSKFFLSGDLFGWIYWFISIVLPLTLAILCFFLAPQLIQRRLKLVSFSKKYPEIHSEIVRLSELGGLSKAPDAFLLESDYPSSFVFGRTIKDAKLVLSEGLVKSLSSKEIDAVILHELGHILNKDMFFMTWGTTFLKALKYWFLLFTVFVITSSILTGSLLNPTGLSFWVILYWALLFFLLPMLIIYSVSRIREFLADAQVIIISGDHSYLSAALLKISKSLILTSIKQRISSFSVGLSITGLYPFKGVKNILFRYTIGTHPNLAERLEALRTRKYIISGNKIIIPSLETAVHAGILGFYGLLGSFITLAFILNIVEFNPYLAIAIAFAFPILIICILNTHKIGYIPSKILRECKTRELVFFLLGFCVRNLVSCITLWGMFFVMVILSGILEALNIFSLLCALTLLFAVLYSLVMVLIKSREFSDRNIW